MKNIILLGPSYSGKDTQSIYLAKKYDIVHVSTGELLRQSAQAGTDLGLVAKEYMAKGILVPGDIINAIIKPFLVANIGRGFIFNGYPRGPEHIPGFVAMMEELNIAIDVVVVLRVSNDELLRRHHQKNHANLRFDELDMTVVEQRIRVFDEETVDVISYYKDQGILVYDINGEQDASKVSQEIVARLVS